MTRRIWIAVALTFLIGLALGGGTVQIYHVVRANAAKEAFNQKVRCKELAEGYIRQQSNESTSVSLQDVDYSATADSCVGYFHVWEDVGNRNKYNRREWQVVDLLTGKTLYDNECREETNCGGGTDIKSDEEAEAAFDEAVTGKKAKPSSMK